MGDALRSIRIATQDQSVLSTARAALSAAQGAGALEGFAVQQVGAWRDLVEAPPAPGDVLVLDSWLKDGNVYEMLRRLAGRTKCRTYVLIEGQNHVSEPIARFCGATGVLERPITRAKLEGVLGESGGPRPALASEGRGAATAEGPAFTFPETLLAELTGTASSGEESAPAREETDAIMGALIDPATGLFNYSFLSYKLDEEFKRARRFHSPLACAMLGFESQASDDTLRELSSIFLAASRDTDVLGRFDENSFLFLLPNTGPDGAEIMAQRVANTADEGRLLDLVGDRLELSIGIANYPSPNIHRRDDLYASAREAFLEARQAGGGVVVSAL
ncbi:MAG: GGDEF domain-containing protein [Planctomycetota bacterium]|nr:GGDEF domain-containing protein [Planctomycetota bacterium]